MKLKFLVTVDVDPSEMNRPPRDVVRDEIRSNLDSVEYVRGCDVVAYHQTLSTGRGR